MTGLTLIPIETGEALLYMVSRRRARSGELVDAEGSKSVLCNSVFHKQKASWTQVNVSVHEREGECLLDKIYYRFHKRTAAGINFENNFNKTMKKTYVTSMRSLVFF